MAGLSDADVMTALADVDAPNEPARLQSAGTGGTRLMIPPHESRGRREAMSQLLMQGTSMDGIVEIMSMETHPQTGKTGFGMSYDSILNLREEVWATWDEEDAEGRPHYKSAAVRRLHREIIAARGKGAHSAVAMLEKTLMEIQGTAEPIEVHITGDQRLTRSIMEVLGEHDPVELRQMIDEERRRLSAEENAIDTVGESA